jgi:hypothetical protein
MIDGDVDARLVFGKNQAQFSFIFAERVFVNAAIFLNVHNSPSGLIFRNFLRVALATGLKTERFLVAWIVGRAAKKRYQVNTCFLARWRDFQVNT